MSRFYLNNNSVVNNSIWKDVVGFRTTKKAFNGKMNQYRLNNRSNVSMNSLKMQKYLDKFLHKQTYGDSEITA
jgi:hypothetical protein